MKFKVRTNLVMIYILLAFFYYILKNYNSVVLIAGVIFFAAWFCFSDLYYIVEKNKLVIGRIIGTKEINMRDISSLIDPIPVMYKLNPRPGTLELCLKQQKKLSICPKEQVDFIKAIRKTNKKININVKSEKNG